MAGHAQLKFVMTECSKTQIRLTGLKFCHGEQFRALSISLVPCNLASWNCRTIAMNLAGQPHIVMTFKGPSWLTVSNHSVRSIKVELISTLFLAFLLELLCCKCHVYCSSVLPDSTLAFSQSDQDAHVRYSIGLLQVNT